jgi:branched-chain amino acid transport system ATP-binding protein
MSPPAAPLLRLEKVEVVYHRVVTAVQGVSLELRAGQIVALLGTNGAGKTTTLRGISGFIGNDDARVTEGAIVHRGVRIENLPPHRVTQRGIVLVPERDKVFQGLTVAENLEVTVSRRPRAERARAAELAYAYFPKLAERRAHLAGYLSGGERQMLAIAAALMCGPSLLLVDEMSLGLAPLVVEQIAERLQRIRRELGASILMVEQNAHVALGIADYGYVMENGRVVLDGAPARLAAHQDVQEFYLGQGGGERRRSYRDVKQYRRSRRWYG